jgi:hypothetical protein
VLGAGSVIADKYRIVRLLGEGGMGSVYIAENLVLQKQVALKVMSAAFASDASAAERLFREAMSASRARHPAIVEIFDAGHTREGQSWMAMELLDGESLGQRLTRVGALPLGEIVPIFGPVLAALDAVHAHGIVHAISSRNPGVLAMVENGEVRWQVVVPSDPLHAQAQPPEAVAVSDDMIFASYEMTGRGDAPRRVAAFRASDGEPSWDVGLPAARGDRGWYLVGGRELVVLAVNNILLVLDRTTGETRYQIGEPPRGH